MVDFSCALKLAMPISVLSAMRECGRMNMSVKGGKFLEAVAEADTIVFDKTGTLTYAQPKVAEIVPFGKNPENEMLRIAACLEEHFPHSMANAVVEEARIRGLDHEEKHSEVEYIVAHGIAISTGAAIAREIADITIASEDLNALTDLRVTAMALMTRIHRNYRFIMGFNGMLMAAGVAGLIQPTTSAVLHNASTLAVSLRSMTDLNRKPVCRKACRSGRC